MNELERIETRSARWGLDEFAGVVNSLIPAYVPDASLDGRMRQELTPRLIRSYATIGLVDEPARDGRNALYGFRHLLQVLVIRRLLTDGLSTAAIGARVASLSNADLEELLQGGVRVELSVANPALSFLAAIQERSRTGGEGTQSVTASEPESPFAGCAAQDPAATETTWTRVVVADGVELHVRSDLFGSVSGHGRSALADQLARALDRMMRPANGSDERGGKHE